MSSTPPEPIAIVGIGCRFPGDVGSAKDFWRMLHDGVEGIGDIPEGRWDAYESANAENAAALRKTTKVGGFVRDIEGFDAEFFGTSPREAALMDPQQRMTLEVTWEALEHAGIVPRSLAGTDAGVFIGVNTDDHGRRLLEDLPRIEAWTGIGSSMCIVANRVSYVLDLRGPSMVVDTACSASLAALHVACQSLRLGETPLAIAGGVMLMAAPGLTMVMDAAGALSKDGRSHSFDASANGYGRGEGCGVVVLKRLSDARRDGDRVLSVILGSAVHQDGRTNGIMAPSGEAQAHLMRSAYEKAGIAPETVDYVEAHGTGTRVGDPLEAGAMASVFGANRPQDAPCLIGSVKTNIGHLEAASGIAGVIKTVLALDAATIPPTVNFTEPNPEVDWAASGLKVVSERTPWPASDRPRRAGVSGYGYGGTIAHVILEQAPDAPQARSTGDEPTGARVYPLTGATPAGVLANAGRLADWLATSDASLADLGHTLAHRRSHLDWRLAVVAADRDELVARLRDAAAENPTNAVAGAQVLESADRGVVWVFSGHGAQWVGMGTELLATEPLFAEVLDELAPVFVEEIGFSPRQILVDGDLTETHKVQTAIFAVQVALARVWRSYGLRPSAIIGHSVGEIAAAVVGGALSLADGARLICRRSALLTRVAGAGSMAMVNLPFDEVARRLGDRTDLVPAISASANATVIAGDTEAVAELVVDWSTDEDLIVQQVKSDVAFHSPHMDPLLDELAAAAADLTPGAPEVPIYPTALTDPRANPVRDGAYWAANLRNPVRFAAAVTAAVEDGYRVFLEVSAHPVVSYNIDEVLTESGVDDACVAGTLRRNRPEQETLLANLGKLYCRGIEIDWNRAAPDGGLLELPPNAWQHKQYRTDAGPRRAGQVRAHDVASHTLLGGGMTVHGTSSARVWHTYLDHSNRPYPGDHPVQGTEIIPAAVLLNTFLAAASEGKEPPVLADVALRTPVSVAAPRELQILRQGNRVLRLTSRLHDDEVTDSDDGWLTHTVGVACSPSETPVDLPRRLDVGLWRAACTEELDPMFVIDRLAGIGVAAMGFPWEIRELWRAEGRLFARVAADPESDERPASWASVLDAALSAASVVFSGDPILRMPAHIRQFAVHGDSPAEVLLAVRVVEGGPVPDTVDVDIATVDGEVLAAFGGLRYGVLEGDIGAPASPRRLVHELVWSPLDLPDIQAAVDRVVLVGAAAGALGTALNAAGVDTLTVADPEELATVGARLAGAAVLVSPVTDDPVDAAWLVTRTAQVVAAAEQPARLWCLTEGVRDATEPGLAQTPVWGVGRIVAGEHPDIWGGIIDIADTAPNVELLLHVLGGRQDADVIALDEGGAVTSRLAPLEREAPGSRFHCRPDGTYLVTGGLGVLGLAVAEWLIDHGARRLVLAGRSPLPPREEWPAVTDPAVVAQIEAVQAMELAGVTVRTLALDVTDRAAAAAQLSASALGMPPIRGVVHAAGVLDNRMIRDVDEASLRRVMAPKVAGALVLHELFPPGSLDVFALFSSSGYLLGLPGQASYAAANAFLDGLAAHRRRLGGTETVSFGWTSWRGLGMSTSSELIDAELNARGTGDITAAEAFRSWEYVDGCDVAHVAVLRMLPDGPGVSRPPLLREIVVEEATVVEVGDTPWSTLTGDELLEYVTGEVRRQVAAEMKLPPEELDVRRALSEMGLDSVMTLIIRRRLEQQFRLSLPATLLWNRPTVVAVATHLTTLLAPVEEPEEELRYDSAA